MLNPLVALARYDNHAPAPSHPQSSPDGRPPIQHDLVPSPATLGPNCDLASYLCRSFGVGVVGRNYAQLREPSCDPAHQRALRPVPIARRPKHTDNAAWLSILSLLRHRAGDAQDGFELDVGVGVVHDHLKP